MTIPSSAFAIRSRAELICGPAACTALVRPVNMLTAFVTPVPIWSAKLATAGESSGLRSADPGPVRPG